MLETKLVTIKGQLARGEIKLSDALLIISRMLNRKISGKRLLWMNRELLGYLQEDLASLTNESGPQFEKAHMPIPEYRFLAGVWGKPGGDGRIFHLETPRLKEKRIFCNIGIQQIETQLATLNRRKGVDSIFCMSFDALTGAQFFCTAEEIERLYGSVSRRLIDFIDSVDH
ncbi:hypothetical protein GC174_17475 [bacterium]|nr:hypothetical protein [bacterium]